MKKKLFLVLAITFASIAIASATTYYYSFVTSCGHIEYQTFDHKLSKKELLKLNDYYEALYCSTPNPDVNTD